MHDFSRISLKCELVAPSWWVPVSGRIVALNSDGFCIVVDEGHQVLANDPIGVEATLAVSYLRRSVQRGVVVSCNWHFVGRSTILGFRFGDRSSTALLRRCSTILKRSPSHLRLTIPDIKEPGKSTLRIVDLSPERLLVEAPSSHSHLLPGVQYPTGVIAADERTYNIEQLRIVSTWSDTPESSFFLEIEFTATREDRGIEQAIATYAVRGLPSEQYQEGESKKRVKGSFFKESGSLY